MSTLKVGFIGLGNMGMLMAKTQLKNKLPLTVFDIRQEPMLELQKAGAVVAGSARELAAACDVILSMVRDESQIEDSVFGQDGVLQGIKPGSTIIIGSTISPDYCRALSTRLKSRKVHVVDAAVSTESRNFTPGQESAVFTLMVGGDEDVVKKCRPVFESLTRNIFYMGAVGSGAVSKLINNLAMYGNAVVARECLNIGLKAGLDFDQLVEAMRLSTGYSRSLISVARTVRQPRPAPKKTPGPKLKSLEEKDNEAAVGLADSVGAKTPVSHFMFGLDLEHQYDALSKHTPKAKK
jgi:3-hydroxyisobutyrate dehydrogenase